TIATVCDGLPQAADVFYASDGLALYFVSDPTTRHGANMAAQPRVAVTIHEEYNDWRQIQGVQIEGPASLVRSKLELIKATTVYLGKYPWARPFLASPAAISAQVARKAGGIRFYKVIAHWVRRIDNRKGFGHHEELRLT
ncbi:MAG: pyridoxamine 5'-phosphate oxidase family protein, partial [Chloroflexi bacterium]|nr:pyridoxamine 5'-phosphate oxidase family protein [Chloroflexota bacterium]